uniref:Uncharacterized protein n=1 Tax=Arundo donax TaxID=35708 RepID=A0A0A9E5M4_ARUDO
MLATFLPVFASTILQRYEFLKIQKEPSSADWF